MKSIFRLWNLFLLLKESKMLNFYKCYHTVCKKYFRLSVQFFTGFRQLCLNPSVFVPSHMKMLLWLLSYYYFVDNNGRWWLMYETVKDSALWFSLLLTIKINSLLLQTTLVVPTQHKVDKIMIALYYHVNFLFGLYNIVRANYFIVILILNLVYYY